MRIAFILFLLSLVPATAFATGPLAEALSPVRLVLAGPRASEPPPHPFWDRTNVALFTAVAGSRAIDFASTQHFRARGNDEWILTNDIVDDPPLFAGIELAGAAASVGISYLLHRSGHHSLERWLSIVHIGITGYGAAVNFSLD